MLFIKDNFL